MNFRDLRVTGLCGLGAFVLASAISSCHVTDQFAARERRRTATQVIQRIEKFRQDSGRLPDSLGETGTGVRSESDPPVFYQKKSDARFIVWYGTRLGSSMVYDSQTGKWDERN